MKPKAAASATPPNRAASSSLSTRVSTVDDPREVGEQVALAVTSPTATMPTTQEATRPRPARRRAGSARGGRAAPNRADRWHRRG